MIEMTRHQLRIDGTPRIVLCGEIHYFRLARHEWKSRIEAAVAAGCHAVAAYLPWLWHELPDATIDVDGRSRPEKDIGEFIDLCARHGLWFVARPGPFVMAELKNEGLPYRLYRQHPDIVSVGWDGAPAPTRTVDYLAPAFLDEVRRWYGAVMPVLAPRLQPRGGNVIAVQLDNEIGMLAWVSNSPDLTDGLLADFARWLGQRPAEHPPVPFDDPVAFATAIRSPGEAWAARLRVDLGTFMRARFARYVATLRGYAEEYGVAGVPFIVNIHGTEGGSAASFPIGISQLYPSYSGIPGLISGSDHYVGEMTIPATAGLHQLNAFSDAVHDADQPLTSMEFEAGIGDYGNGYDQQYSPSTVDLKTRLFVAQGNRLINYYLFAGGINPMLDEPVEDGDGRIAITGERHGIGAPVGPEGGRGLHFGPTARAVAAVRANERWLAAMREEHDDVVLGFVPDAYMTEYHYPASGVMRTIREDLVTHRGAGPRQALTRSLLLAGYRFGAVDLQRDDPDRMRRVVVLASGRHLDPAVQRRLCDHLHAGGGLLLLGPPPEADLLGRECTILIDALGVRVGSARNADRGYRPSVTGAGWASAWPETPVGWTVPLSISDGDVVLREAGTGQACAVEVHCGAGRAALLAAELPADPDLFRRLVERLGASAGLTHDAAVPGLVATTTVGDDGGRLVHLLNVSGFDNPARLWLDGQALFGGHSVPLPARTGRMLPVGLRLPRATIAWSTAEISAADEYGVSLDLLTPLEPDAVAAPPVRSGWVDMLALDTDRGVAANLPIHLRRADGLTVVSVQDDRPHRTTLALTFD
jgi:beta-galactosidase